MIQLQRVNPGSVAYAAVLRRIGGVLLLLWLVLTLTFALIRLAPGDAATFLVSPAASAADAARIRTELGLDRSIAVQYARWAAGLLRGDLGESFSLHQPVRAALADALPVSVGLGTASLVLTFLIGVPLGLLQAVRRGRPIDRLLTVVTTFVYAAPSFWLALALVAVFTYGAAAWGLPPSLRLPAFGLHAPGLELHGWAAFADLVRHALLPVAILTAVGAAGIARFSRSSIADVITQDFVRTAQAKGASPARVHFRHVLANVLPMLVVLFALSLPGLVAGSIFVESVFAWPGMGHLMVNAIVARDYPLVMGAATVYAAIVIFANLLGDLALPIVDPRRRA
jgi:peptide/nickel transport system permease protein